MMTSRNYSDLQLLRHLVEQRSGLVEHETTEAQVVLRLIQYLYTTGGDTYNYLFDMIAEVYTDGVLWDFEQEEVNGYK